MIPFPDLAPYLKAAHLIAAMLWTGGSVAAAVLAARPEAGLQAGGHVFGWYRRWVTPAMLVTIAFGLATAQALGLRSAPWLMVKLGLIFVLTGLHIALSGALRRLAWGDLRPVPGPLVWGVLASVAGIVALAVLRPGG
ncbi:MAG: CopD family protein [Shimia sp.]